MTAVARKLALLLAALLAITAALAADDARTPDELVADTANAVARRVEGDRAHLEKSPEELYRLVDQVFLPVFDTAYAGRLVLGRHWRTATPEQRRAFVDTFYDFLVRSYAPSLLQFRQDRLRILSSPQAPGPDEQRTLVRTQMQLNDGSTLPVDYALRRTPQGWRVYDVRIEGVSYVQNYRNQFDAEITAKGLDEVIARLRAETPDGQPKPAAGT